MTVLHHFDVEHLSPKAHRSHLVEPDSMSLQHLVSMQLWPSALPGSCGRPLGCGLGALVSGSVASLQAPGNAKNKGNHQRHKRKARATHHHQRSQGQPRPKKRGNNNHKNICNHKDPHHHQDAKSALDVLNMFNIDLTTRKDIGFLTFNVYCSKFTCISSV